MQDDADGRATRWGQEAEDYEADGEPGADATPRLKKGEGPRVVRLLIRLVRPAADPVDPPAEPAEDPADAEAADN